MNDKEMIKVRKYTKKALITAENICCGCRDCIEKECRGWWVKFNLKKALCNIPK